MSNKLIATYKFKTTAYSGMPALNILMTDGEKFMIKQRLFIDKDDYTQPYPAQVLREWKDYYYVERYVTLFYETLAEIVEVFDEAIIEIEAKKMEGVDQ